MSFYRKIDVKVHNDVKFRSLSDKAKLLWFTLITFPDLTAVGAMKFTISGMAEFMKWDIKAFREAFLEVLSKGMIQYDENANFLCFPNFIKYNMPENPNVVKSWVKLEGMLPECSLKDKYLQSVKVFMEGFSKAFAEAMPKGLLKDPPKGYVETETETETEIKALPKIQNIKTQNHSRFSEFYDLYPKHVNRAAAQKSWDKYKFTPDQQEEIIAALKKQLVGDNFSDDKKFIAGPEVWLNNKRWEDEIIPKKGNRKTHSPAKPPNITDEDWQFYLRFKKEPYGTMEQNERFDSILKQIGAIQCQA